MKQNIKKSVERRLAIVAGQVKGVRDMVDREQYCVDIITQIEAVREALSGVGNLVLRNHLETHIAHSIRHGNEKKATAEILKIYKLGQK
ncbi:MAG: metal-sensitive transcriptional regulator [Patescibacteria group bacterium]|nr:metal-sensitive transcriptional regulator [Patescibacteria group bacterium]MDE1946077.1 metal-sensitive transcriptional regulator [Patescibacteria group bacterium]